MFEKKHKNYVNYKYRNNRMSILDKKNCEHKL